MTAGRTQPPANIRCDQYMKFILMFIFVFIAQIDIRPVAAEFLPPPEIFENVARKQQIRSISMAPKDVWVSVCIAAFVSQGLE